MSHLQSPVQRARKSSRSTAKEHATVSSSRKNALSPPRNGGIRAELTLVPPGLSVNALKSLYYLHGETESMSELADKLHVTRAAMTGVIDVMEKMKIAKRTAHPNDRRRTIVVLTKAGKELAETVFIRS